jgi:DNA-directed RNA polymerase specialized sigma subunit
MTIYEKSAIIGYYRNGMANELIAYIMGITESYVRQIVSEYLSVTE